ncbi:FAD-dependent oxidoreductase [Herbihabitans rhizosphaerae]|uniref:FAD-dependent oxidoreductase n=1 Tax=Herbihabitans rhizosphaerae TaxID=1872711 RepID=UPI001F5FB4E8|nr:FAD-dependent monooxygenase [Herbihabitans rhizosphaerae]
MTAVDGIGDNDETAEVDAVLFDNTGSYLLWAYFARHDGYPDGLSTMDGARLRETVGELIGDWHPALRALVERSPEETVSLLPIRTSVPIDPWPASTVTLLGDAIHSMTPFRGIGANTALRDARLLCRALVAVSRGEAELLDAISDYESAMRAYGFKAVRDSLRTAEQSVSGNRPAKIMFKTVLRVLNAVGPLKRKVFGDHGTE